MSNQKLYVKDVMTSEPVAVKPGDSVVYAAKLLHEHGFSGLPVIDDNGTAVGIVTEYDLISKGEALHLPTLINILGNIDVYKKDNSLVKDDLKRMMILKVEDVMNKDPLIVEQDAPIQLLAELFAHHHRVNPIVVADKNKKVTGVVSRFDVIRFFVDEDTDREVEMSRPEVLDRKVDTFIEKFEKKFSSASKVKVKGWLFMSFVSVAIGLGIIVALVLVILKK